MRQWAGERPREGASLWITDQLERFLIFLISYFSRSNFSSNLILSHSTGCTGIHAGWQGSCSCPAQDWCLLSGSLPAASLVLQTQWQLKCFLSGSNVGQVFGAAFWSQSCSFQIKKLSFYIKRCYTSEGSPFNGGLWLRMLRKGFYPSDQECSPSQVEREKEAGDWFHWWPLSEHSGSWWINRQLMAWRALNKALWPLSCFLNWK